MHIHGGSLPPDNRNRMNPHKPGNTGTSGQSSRPEDTNPNSHEPRNPKKGIEPKPETPFTFGKSDPSPIFSSPDYIVPYGLSLTRRDMRISVINQLKNGNLLLNPPPQPAPNPPDDGPVAD
ncbi:MAG: hypothetical protein KC474_10230 [Cyanobacteria bacterium HKST-UBA04]|nr:hypothetical protein [Cyanobacteria bacterium HKST-UBA05]MCA9799917.1 hypothetical protein [Cyanobacteria bacterium HKST-UBA04]